MGVPLNNSKVQKMFWKNVLGNFETVTIKCKISLERTNRKKKKKMFTRSISDLEMKIWIYWSESKSWLYIYISIYLYILKNWKNWKIDWSKRSFTGLGPEDRCSSWGLPFFLYSFLWFIIFFSSIFVEFYCIFIITMSFWVKRFHPWNLQNLRNIIDLM